MPGPSKKKQIAGAFRAVADLVDQFDIPSAPYRELHLVAWRSGGQAARIVAGMTDSTSDPYTTDSTKYVIYRGVLLGIPVEIMESQDD